MAQQTIQVIIIEHDVEARSVLQAALAGVGHVEVVAETDSTLYGYELVRQNHPQMVFVGVREEEPHKALDVINKISTYFKDVLIVASGDVVNLDRIMATMQAGAREYLKRPLHTEDIVNAVNKHHLALTVDATGDTSGRILTVFSNKGGLGKTTLAVNLALALSEVTEKPVALVDLNLQLGDVSTFLDITPKQTIVDIAKEIGRVDAAYLENSLAQFQHGKSNLYILADPLHVEEAEEVTAEQINSVLTVLKSVFEYVVVDTTTSFDAKTLTALDLADSILLVSIVNLPSIRSSQRVLSLFERLGYSDQKVKLIVNRHVPDDEITIEDLEDTLDYKVFWKIPNSYQSIMMAINRGLPLREVERGEAVFEHFLECARHLTGIVRKPAKSKQAPVTKPASAPTEGKEKNGSLLSSLFGKK